MWCVGAMDLYPSCLQADGDLASLKAAHGNTRIDLKEVVLVVVCKRSKSEPATVVAIAAYLHVELCHADFIIRFHSFKRQSSPEPS
jgi:hypothetical protein